MGDGYKGDGYIRRAQLNQISLTYSQGSLGFFYLIDMCNKEVSVESLTTALIWSFKVKRTSAIFVA